MHYTAWLMGYLRLTLNKAGQIALQDRAGFQHQILPRSIFFALRPAAAAADQLPSCRPVPAGFELASAEAF